MPCRRRARSARDTVAATKQARLFGADAVLVVTPYYVKPSQARLRPLRRSPTPSTCRSCSTTSPAARA